MCYRNVIQILRSVEIGESARFASSSSVAIEVHPHNWGEVADFGDGGADGTSDANAGNNTNRNRYDLVTVSDCIYNVDGHEALLVSLADALALPDLATRKAGVAVLSARRRAIRNGEHRRASTGAQGGMEHGRYHGRPRIIHGGHGTRLLGKLTSCR